MSALRASVSLTLLALPLTACGGGLTSSEWVAEPEAGAVVADAPATLEHDTALAYTTSDSAPKAGPQRLDHTVTLGEVVATPRDPAAAVAGAPAPASITINVNNYGAPASYGYGAAIVGDGLGSRSVGTAPTASAATSRGSGSSNIVPGQSWPSPASHGPSFPFSTSPASPWESKR